MADVRSLFRQILHLRETPHRTALAFAVGVVIGFSPAYGLHMLMVGFCAWAFGLNLIALLAGAFLNNPWTLSPFSEEPIGPEPHYWASMTFPPSIGAT